MLKISVGVVLHGDQVLIGRRSNDQTLGGLWEFPGGKVNSGETFEQAAVRECREETGLNVEISHLLCERFYEYDHGEHHLRFFACTAEPDIQSPQYGFRWVERSDLANYEFPPANAEVLKLITVPID